MQCVVRVTALQGFLCDQSNQLWIITVEHGALLRASALHTQEEHDAAERMKAWILTSTLQMTLHWSMFNLTSLDRQFE